MQTCSIVCSWCDSSSSPYLHHLSINQHVLFPCLPLIKWSFDKRNKTIFGRQLPLFPPSSSDLLHPRLIRRLNELFPPELPPPASVIITNGVVYQCITIRCPSFISFSFYPSRSLKWGSRARRACVPPRETFEGSTLEKLSAGVPVFLHRRFTCSKDGRLRDSTRNHTGIYNLIHPLFYRWFYVGSVDVTSGSKVVRCLMMSDYNIIVSETVALAGRLLLYVI